MKLEEMIESMGKLTRAETALVADRLREAEQDWVKSGNEIFGLNAKFELVQVSDRFEDEMNEAIFFAVLNVYESRSEARYGFGDRVLLLGHLNAVIVGNIETYADGKAYKVAIEGQEDLHTHYTYELSPRE